MGSFFDNGNIVRMVGLVILVVGVVLLGFGLNSSQTMAEKLIENVSGRYTSHTMWYIIGGIAMMVGGGVLLIFGKRF